MTSTIAVTRWIPDEALKVLAEAGEVKLSRADRPLTPDELREFVRGSSAIVGMLHDRIDGEVADAAGPDLKVVANVAVGYDNIDVPALAGRGITVTNTPGVLTDATADLAFGLILAVTRRLGEGERLLRSRTPWSFHLGFLLGSSLQDKTLGIVGLGQIGQAVARRALGFGMRIVYSGRSRAAEDVEKALGAQYVPFAELLRSSDVVSLHCPLTPETRHLVDADALKAMKPGAYLINTTRGPVVHEAALADALEAGEIAGAGLDVFEAEPEVEPRLLGRENVVLTPHLGSATVETRTAMAVLAAENVASVLTGGNPLTEVRP
ncbi:2-hydroxyacid dehydrogenase [Amycolatopsis keratiniphila]|uniref:D-glycerate dehydrogenase n=1 Tax=Amycolatopsis keratiniphila subsp. keratiniphila TaxID=227715 RepID=A0A1W2LYY6_9PSEU|nr:D-glycerate dehydrogenase [Amycolatopsis keratiniphila]OLZ58885.1 D-glycerate dehydrogenase [Amycolatopsis keratiniphila subsp. nogabecina]ONF72450.1 D-glycerate dehydrogenase [Amycolatopsis keratiniphila subsp. keratiniphila]SDU70304.1 Lactate dehydrogenase [Amycolatopsis keratiniphila]